MKIFLLGMPGSGKSTLGRELSRQLHIPFVDLDTEVEKKEGRPITAIFKDSGESFFREVEAVTLRNLASALTDFVMSTGGGAPCFHNNMDMMSQTGKTLLLDPPIPVLVDRLRKEGTASRPLLDNVADLEMHLKTLRVQRAVYYEQAMYRTEHAGVPEILRLFGLNT